MSWILAILGFIIGGVVAYVVAQSQRRKEVAAATIDMGAARAEAEELIREARSKSELAVKEAEVKSKDILVGARAEAEREVRERRKELTALETKIESREETLEKRLEAFERREADLNRRDQGVRTREKNITDKEAQHQALIDEARVKLEHVANLTREEAKRALVEEMTGAARTEAAKHIRVI